MKNYSKSLRTLAVAAAVVSSVAPASYAAETCPAGTVAGKIFRDYNANGRRDSAEAGVAGITVKAFAQNESLLASATSAADGTYSLAITSGTAARIEVSDLPSYLRFGPANGAEASDVRFISTNACGVDFAVANPGEHCNEAPTDASLVTSKFVNGDPLAGGTAAVRDAIIAWNYAAQGYDLGLRRVAGHGDVGAIWGLAYQRSTKTLFAAAYMKRHTGFGPLGASGLYAIDMTNPSAPVVRNLVALSTLGISAGVDPRSPGQLSGVAAEPNVDPDSWSAVGEMGLADIELSEDEQTLYVMNLFDRSVYAIAIGLSGQTPSAGAVTRLALDNPGCSFGDYAPFALRAHDGDLYAGVVCTAKTSQDANDLRALVLKKNKASAGWSTTFEMSLNYPRGYGISSSGPSSGLFGGLIPSFPSNLGDWRPWKATFADLLGGVVAPYFTFYSYPQAMLSNIEFTEQGDIVLSLRDRSADQYGAFNFSPTASGAPGAGPFEHGAAVGDQLIACRLANGTYALESNGSCAGRATSGGASNGEGPGGGEFFNGDNMAFAGTTLDAHQETFLGATAYRYGSGEIISTGYNVDKLTNETGGILKSAMANGGLSGFGEIYPAVAIENFGKSAGLGDLEILCDPAPVQIGNRVWLDLDADGRQDAQEPGVTGVTVQLVDAVSGAIINSKLTDSDGRYYFTKADGVRSGGRYLIRLGRSADYSDTGALAGLSLTSANVAGSDATDSDAVLSNGFAQIAVTVGSAGENNHALDIGFVAPVCTVTSLRDVSITVDGSAKSLLNASRKARRWLNDARARGCKTGISSSRLKALLAEQDRLHLAVWRGAWTLPAETLSCTAVTTRCVSTSITDFTAQLAAQTSTMKRNLDTLVNNRCIKKQRGATAARKLGARVTTASLAKITSLGGSLLSCK